MVALKKHDDFSALREVLIQALKDNTVKNKLKNGLKYG